jgi:hypothetical protein
VIQAHSRHIQSNLGTRPNRVGANAEPNVTRPPHRSRFLGHDLPE